MSYPCHVKVNTDNIVVKATADLSSLFLFLTANDVDFKFRKLKDACHEYFLGLYFQFLLRSFLQLQ